MHRYVLMFLAALIFYISLLLFCLEEEEGNEQIRVGALVRINEEKIEGSNFLGFFNPLIQLNAVKNT